MNYSAILHEIDVELNKLLQVRDLLAAPLKPEPRKKSVPRKPALKKVSASPTQPVVTILPPKLKREYRRTIKSHVPEPRALAAPRSDKVVVYMARKASLQAAANHGITPQASETLESVMRQKLLGGSAQISLGE